jgi:hypothetical protein
MAYSGKKISLHESKNRVRPASSSVCVKEPGEASDAKGVSGRLVRQLVSSKSSKKKKQKGGRKSPLSVGLSQEEDPLEGGEAMMSVSMARSVLDPRSVYRFRLIDFNSFSTSGAGVLAAYISCSPSVTSFSEYTSLTNLFTEVRLVAARSHICNVNPHADGYATGFVKSDLAMNYNDLSVSTTPASVLAVLDNAHSWLHPLGKSTVSTYSAMVSKDRQFADTAAPSPGPYAGCTGQFTIYQSALTASTTYIDYFLECEFEFRNRD